MNVLDPPYIVSSLAAVVVALALAVYKLQGDRIKYLETQNESILRHNDDLRDRLKTEQDTNIKHTDLLNRILNIAEGDRFDRLLSDHVGVARPTRKGRAGNEERENA